MIDPLKREANVRRLLVRIGRRDVAIWTRKQRIGRPDAATWTRKQQARRPVWRGMRTKAVEEAGR